MSTAARENQSPLRLCSKVLDQSGLQSTILIQNTHTLSPFLLPFLSLSLPLPSPLSLRVKLKVGQENLIQMS